MKLYILSDLHIEFQDFELPKSLEYDAVVLAGDVHTGLNGAKWAIQHFPNIPVFYIFGNHEFYGQKYPGIIAKAKELCRNSNVHILNNKTYTMKDVTFFGSTLWTDFNLHGTPEVSGYQATELMTDFKKIRIAPSYKKLKSVDTAGIHYKSKNWLKEELRYHHKKTVVITHHAPSAQSLPEKRKNDKLSPAYASPLESLVEKSKADLWIHGHIHHSADYKIGKTRVLCNPRGYLPNHPNKGFDPELIVEI